MWLNEGGARRLSAFLSPLAVLAVVQLSVLVATTPLPWAEYTVTKHSVCFLQLSGFWNIGSSAGSQRLIKPSAMI